MRYVLDANWAIHALAGRPPYVDTLRRLEPEGGNDVPSVDQVIAYLRCFTGTPRDRAKQYIEYTPRQIDTEYRRRIEATLGWSCKEC